MGANCCRGSNEDPYTLQKDVNIDKLNKASSVGQMIRHSDNFDNKQESIIEEKKELVYMSPDTHKRESSFVEDSTGASNIQIQESTPNTTSEAAVEKPEKEN